MLKKKRFALLFCFFILIYGCKLTPPPTPSGKPASKGESVSEERYSANYYYLESRFHIKAKDIGKAQLSLEKAIELDPHSYILNRDLIRIHLVQQNKDKAIELVDKLVQNNPDNVESLLLFVQLKKDDIQEDELIGILEKILKLDPENKETFLRLGQVYMDKENKAKALSLFKTMAERFPEYYVAWYYLGEIYLFEKKYDLAKPAFDRTIALEPELVEPKLQLIKVLKGLREENGLTQIESVYTDILALDPINNRALLGIALTRYKLGKKKEAEKMFQDLGRESDQNTKILMTAVDEYLTEDTREDALIVFPQMLNGNPESGTLNYFTAIAFQDRKDFNKALFHYEKIKPKHPQYQKAGLSMALIYKEMDKIDRAVELLEKRLQETPKDVETMSYLSSFYETLNQYDKGIALLQKGIEYAPKDTSLRFRLGALLDKAGFNDQALDAMRAIIEIDPNDASALNYLGYSYADQNIRLDEALTLIQRANTIRPDDGYITDSLGWVYYRLGKYDQAVKYLEKAAMLTDYDTIIADHLADAYLKIGKKDKAIAMYKKALANAESDDHFNIVPDIKKKLERLTSTADE